MVFPVTLLALSVKADGLADWEPVLCVLECTERWCFYYLAEPGGSRMVLALSNISISTRFVTILPPVFLLSYILSLALEV